MTIFFFILIVAYVLGNLLTGTMISRFFYQKDIRAEGSRNPGARNAGRLYGKKAFIATFIGDALKGTFAVLLAKQLGDGTDIELLALFAVTLGHVYPILYKFRGGKGVSTFIGGMLAFDPLVFGLFIGLFVLFYPIFRSFTLAGLSAILLMPVIVLGFSYGIVAFLIACCVSILVIYAHRDDLQKNFTREKS